MSLWEKWEREKQEKAGIKVERHSDVKILDAKSKVNLRKQAGIVAGVLAVCLLLLYLAVVVESFSTGRQWSDTYIVRFFVERNAQRNAAQQAQE